MIVESGLQFKNYVYKDKVVKKPRTLAGVIIKYLSWKPVLLFHPDKLFKDSLNSLSYTREQFKDLKLRKGIFDFLGIVEIKDNSIIQKRCVPLGNFLERNSIEENKKMLVKYFKFIQKMWSNGFFESTFEFAVNYGITRDGKINLIDVGELCFEKAKAIRYIKQKYWLTKWSYRKKIPNKLKDFYKFKADEYLTLKQLNRYWKDNKIKVI